MGARGIGAKPLGKRKPGQQPKVRAGTPLPDQPDIPDLHPRYKGRKDPPGTPDLLERLQDDSQNLWTDLQDAVYVAKSEPAPNIKVVGEEGIEPWLVPGLTRSQRVIAFCEDLMVTSGADAGKKFKLRDFQIEFIEAVYREDDGGNRPIRTAILSMGRKNGKTALAAALALCHLLGPESENRGEVYSCANDRFQAGKVYHEMVALINAHPRFAKRVNILRFQKIIEDLINGSLYCALSAEAKTKMGLNPSFVCYDELGVSTDRHLYDAMDSALGARRDPLLMVISTQAPNDLAPMSQLIDYGLKIQAGELEDPSFHLTLYAAPEDADPWDEATWRLANPALGDFLSLSNVQRLAQQAQRMPSQESSFRNLILNQRVSAQSKYIESSEWNACADEPIIPLGSKIYAALDLGSTRDMSALVMVHEDANDDFHVKCEFWLPGNIQERCDQDRAPYDVWIRDGLLNEAGKSTDPKLIALRIAEISSEYRLMTLAFDRWRINDLKRELDAIGCDVTLVPHGQGFKDMTPAVDIVERLIIQRRIRHGGNPVLRMCVSNAVVTRDPAGGRKLDKSKSTGRIDGIVAMAMAFSVALIKTEAPLDVGAMIA
jgi:phage terminase large subunit-like protein